VSRIYAARFSLPAGAMLETGYPACDQLCRPAGTSVQKREAMARILPGTPPADRLILYAPTFRRRSKTRYFPFEDVDIDNITAFLEHQNALIALRSHPNDRSVAGAFARPGNRIVHAGHDRIEDVNHLLLLADAIVTDYSGIYLEGLLRDIPCIFLPYDRESYERGFPYPYDEHTPGPKPGTQSGFLECLARALSGDDAFSRHRAEIRDLYFTETDGRSAERVITFIEEKLLRDTL
jgi:CDP-glycerol glycerophosphotransferase (TagB/SpsB family)